MIDALRRVWLALLVVIVVVIAGLAVSRARTFFGSSGVVKTPVVFGEDPKPFIPKVVKYEISGSGSYANINYLDLNAKPQRTDHAPLPWSVTLETTAGSAAPVILGQGDGNSISCRITVDDKVKDERTATGVDALTYCFVKSA